MCRLLVQRPGGGKVLHDVFAALQHAAQPDGGLDVVLFGEGEQGFRGKQVFALLLVLLGAFEAGRRLVRNGVQAGAQCLQRRGACRLLLRRGGCLWRRRGVFRLNCGGKGKEEKGGTDLHDVIPVGVGREL